MSTIIEKPAARKASKAAEPVPATPAPAPTSLKVQNRPDMLAPERYRMQEPETYEECFEIVRRFCFLFKQSVCDGEALYIDKIAAFDHPMSARRLDLPDPEGEAKYDRHPEVMDEDEERWAERQWRLVENLGDGFLDGAPAAETGPRMREMAGAAAALESFADMLDVCAMRARRVHGAAMHGWTLAYNAQCEKRREREQAGA